MALSDDQRALLRLLARREEGYEDIAALKGMSVAEVRAEVNAALDELAAEPEPAPPAPPEPVPPQPPEPPAPPKPPEQAPAAAAPANRPGRQPPAIPPERRRLLALAGAAVGVVAVVLIAIVVFGGDSSSGTSGGGSAGSETAEPASAEGGGLTQANLEPVDGGDASGRAIFGRVGKEEIVLQVTAENLEPAQGGSSYTVWLYRSPQLALRVGSAKVGKTGRLGARFPIPTELLAYVASGAFKQIKVSRTSDAAYEAEVRRAKKQKALPPYSGETVMSGKITGPIVRGGASQGG
jgi:hypothetical protein